MLLSLWPFLNSSRIPSFALLLSHPQHLRYAEFMIKGGTPNHQYGCVWILQVFIARVFIAVLTHQMTGWRPELAAFLVFLCCVWMLTVLTIAMPYGTRIENVISLGWTTMLVFVSGVLFVKEAVEKVRCARARDLQKLIV